MKYTILIIFSFILQNIYAEKVLQVEDTKIPFSVIKTIKQGTSYIYPRYATMSLDNFVKELSDFYLVVNYAKQKGEAKKPLAKYLMDRALYDFFIRNSMHSKYNTKKISTVALRRFYKQNPNIKFKRLVIFFNPSDINAKKKAYKKLSFLRGQLIRKEITFDKALKTFPSSIKNMNGIFSNMSMLDLPPQEVAILKHLKPGSYSPVIAEKNFVALYGLDKKYHFASITNKKELKYKYIQAKVAEDLNKLIQELRETKKDKIKIYED